MNSIILQLASRYVKSLLLFFALLALLRGHNQPGGGFIGGLLATLSLIYHSFAYNWQSNYQKLKLKPVGYLLTGLGLIILSLLPGIISHQAPMTGLWTGIPAGAAGELKLGTPLLFDAGVFMAVIGVTLTFFFTLIKNR